MEVTTSVHIKAPPAVVFAALADIPGWADRIGAITRIDMLSEGPVGVGTRFRETRRMFGREATEEMEVAEFKPSKSFVLSAENHGTRYRSVHRLTPANDGTLLALTFTGTPVTLTARLMSPFANLMSSAVRKAIEGDLADLKAAVESGSV